MIRPFCSFLVGSLLASLATPARAQSPRMPETYSFLETSSLMWPEMTVKVNRNGSKELVERTRIPKPGDSGQFHDRVLYDFQAHRIYSVDLISTVCTTQEYASPYAPMFDPIGGSEKMVAGFASNPPKDLRRETVNGIATKVFEVALPEGQGKYKVWLDEKLNFIVKWAVALGSGPETTQLEIRQLSYDPSPASLFVAPSGCTPVGGVATAEGGHAEMTVEAEVPPQTKQLGEDSGRVSGARPDAADAPPSRSGAGTVARVTAVRLRLVPDSYSGPCPGQVQLVGEFTTNGPGTVWYQFLAGAVSHSPEGTVSFDAAGTKTVTIEGTFRAAPRVPHASLIAAMQDQEGRHGPQTVTSGPVTYNITCAGQK